MKARPRAGRLVPAIALSIAFSTGLAACAETPFSWQEAARDWLANLCEESDRCDRWGDGAVFH